MTRSYRRLRLVVVPLALAALVLASCGSNKKESTTSAGGSTGGHTAKIAIIVPLSGDLSAFGLGIRNSVDLAVRQANAAKKIPGWTIAIDPEDDTAKADVGAQVASKVASDPEVAGVVGTMNSSVAQQVQPILDKANIVMVSPANTNPTLTQGADPNSKKRPFHDYFRVATTDAIQGPAAADFVADTLQLKKVAVVHDKKTYGQGLTDAFKVQFAKKGGTVVSTETVNPGDKDFAAVISKIQPLNPQLVYYGGEYPEASLLTSQMKQAGLKVPLMGGDGIYDKTYMATGGAATEGDYATNVGAPADQLASARKFIDDYKAAGFKDDFSAYGAYSFDAANVIINALAKVLPGKKAVDDSVRQAVIDAVQGTQLDGVTGKVSFDQFGDTTTKVITVYKVTGGAFKPEKTADFANSK
jgi:branched-chain amino acid transport system substrate-binding protein